MKAQNHVMIVLLLFLCATCSTGMATLDPTTDIVNIGGLFALTGWSAEWGEEELKGATLAIEKYEGKIPVKFIVEDTTSDNAATVTAAQKLINVDGVDVIIGPTWFETYQSAAPLADTYQVPMISPSGSITALKSEVLYPYTYSTWYRADEHAKAILEEIETQGAKTFVLLFGNEPYWVDFWSYLEENEGSVELLGKFLLNSGDNDYRTVLTEIRTLNPDVVVFGMDSTDAFHSVLKQRKELGLEMLFVSESTLAGLAKRDVFDGLRDNVLLTTPVITHTSFNNQFKERWGYDPQHSSTNAYDATVFVLQAIEEGHTTGESINRYLLMNSWETVTFGKARFDGLGGITGGNFETITMEGAASPTNAPS